jgi:hypothetical protein
MKTDDKWLDKEQKWIRVYFPIEECAPPPIRGFHFLMFTVKWGKSRGFRFRLPFFMFVWNNY